MQLYIDGEKQDLSEYESDNLAGLLEEVKSNFEGRMIHSLKVDGEGMNPDKLENNPDLDEVKSIDIELIEKEKFAEELDKFQKKAPELKKGFKQAQTEFKLGDNDRGYEKFMSTLDDLEWCILFIQKMGKLSKVDFNTESIEIMEEGFKWIKSLTESVQEMGLQDTSVLIDFAEDLIEYAENIEQLSEMIYEKAKEIDNQKN